MGTKKRGLQTILDTIESGPERSPLFRYMLENHDDLVRAATGGRIRWGPLSRQFAELGLLDGEGKPPSPENARNTWLNVRREVSRRHAVAQSRINPSRSPTGWRPAVASHGPVPTRPFAPSPATDWGAAGGGTANQSANEGDKLLAAEAHLAALRRSIKARSG